MADLPADVGVSARYSASIEDVATIVPEALAAVGQTEVDRNRPDSASIVVLGSRDFSLWTWGEVSRTLATTPSEGGAEVRVVTRSRDVFDFWPATSRSLRIIAEIDGLLGPNAIALMVGDRVRGIGTGGTLVEGTLVAHELAGLALSGTGAEAPASSLDVLRELQIRRGSYGHARTGGAVGGSLGFVLLFVAVGTCFEGVFAEPNSSWYCDSQAVNWAPVIGAVVGTLFGSAIRTTVWSRVQSQP